MLLSQMIHPNAVQGFKCVAVYSWLAKVAQKKSTSRGVHHVCLVAVQQLNTFVKLI